MRKQRQFLWLTIVAILVGLAGMAACGSREAELSFETIERNDNYSPEEGYGGLESRVVLVTSSEEIERLEGLVNQGALDQLMTLDFQQYFAIALFRGRQASSGYDTIIERIARRGDKVVVYAQLWEPSPYWEVTGSETSPYHMVKVRRDGGVIQEAALALQSRVVTPTPPSR